MGFTNKINIYFDTMGCAKNLVDSEYALGGLRAAGFGLTEDPFAAQVVVVNTCGFINDAKQESIERLLELAALKQEGECLLLAATGCLVQRYRQELPAELPEVDLWLGTDEYDQLPERLWQALAEHSGQKLAKLQKQAGAKPSGECAELPERVLLTPPYTAYLKIAEGCSNRCSFCAIPNIRGPLRSQPLEQLLAEAARLKAAGVQELCLIAQDTTAYGRDLPEHKPLLPQLLRELDKLGFGMLRLLYAYPEGIDEELLAAMRDCRTVCHYLDLPLQHVSAAVLRRMNRRLDRESIEQLLTKIREYLPDAALRTTFMVGFPGETEADFEELLDFAAAAQLDWAGVFQYSPEEDTPAATMPEQVPDEIKARRYNQLTAVLADAGAARREAQVGESLNVLLERPSLDVPGYFEARSQFQAPEVDGLIYVQNVDGRLTERQIGSWLKVEAAAAEGYDLLATPCEGAQPQKHNKQA